MDRFDQNIKDLLNYDAGSLQANDIIHENLMNRFNERAVKNRVKQNSFIQPLLHLFGSKFMAMKIGVAAAVLIGFMGIRQLQENRPYTLHCDSTNFLQSIDTLNKSITYTDSLKR